MAGSSKSPQTVNAGEVAERMCGGNVNWYRHLWRTVWFLKKLKIELLYDPSIPPWANIRRKSRSKRIYVPCVHCSTVYRGMDREDVHIYNGIFSSVQSLSRVRLFATP